MRAEGNNLAARDLSFASTEKAKCAALLDVRMNRLNVAGALFFIAGTLILLGIITAEATYPSYSVSQNYISDLEGRDKRRTYAAGSRCP